MSTFLDHIRAADPERHARRLAPAGAVLCLAGAALANALGVALALSGLTLLLVSCLSREDGLLVLGPFARYELRRLAYHRRPPAFWRAVYAGAIFLILVGHVWSYFPHMFGFSDRLQEYDTTRMEYVGQQVFNWIAVSQFLLLSYFTVQLLAPIVAEEREAKRLDFLLVTDLRNREILIGKAVGRAPQLLDPILASLPVLAVLPLLGGVPPAFVVGAACGTLATVLGLAGLSFFCSIVSPTGRKAVSMVVGLCFAYLIFSGVLWGIAMEPRVWSFPASVGLRSPIEVSDLVIAASAGNPLTAIIRMFDDIDAGANAETRILDAVRNYSLFQMGVFACFGLMAVARLRQAEVIDVTAKSPPAAPKSADTPAPPSVRPPVPDDAVAWHEQYHETKMRRLPESWASTRGQFVGGIVIMILAHVLYWMLPNADPEVPAIIVGVIVWCMGLLAMLVGSGRASATVAREREKDTLEGLMLTGLGCREILRQKWRGCVTALTPLYVVLLGVMTAGVVSGTLHPLSAALLAVAIPVHAGFAASLGLVFSVRAKNPSRAVWTMWLAVLGVAWAMSFPIIGIFHVLGEPEAIQAPFAVAVIPPAATGAMLLAVDERALQPSRPGEGAWALVGASIGVLLYAGLGRLLWLAAVRGFENEWEVRR